MSRVKIFPSLTNWARRPVAMWAMVPPIGPKSSQLPASARRATELWAVHLSQLEMHAALPLVAVMELDRRLAQVLDRLTTG